MESEAQKPSARILVVNPNSSQSITDGIKSALQEQEVSIEFMTGPASSPAAINNEDEAQQSAEACLPVILERMNQPEPPSAILVACYSEHPLVPRLRKEVATNGFHVKGIFEASIDAALKSIKPGEKFGVVTTGKDWEPVLTEGVLQYLNEGAEDAEPDSFAGVIGTGLGVLELHGGDAGNAQTLMAQAAKELASKGARAICLGCAGMSGLERTIEDAVNEEGSKKKIAVIDGVQHGVRQLVALIT